MLQYDFEDSVGYWLVMTTRSVRRELDLELATQGITLRQWEVLAWLTLEQGMTQSELADRLGIEAPTLGGILDRMERDAWVERYGCPHDRRKKRLRATPKAEAVWQKMVECAYRVRERATTGISAEELRFLKDICCRIRNNLEPESVVETEPATQPVEFVSLLGTPRSIDPNLTRSGVSPT